MSYYKKGDWNAQCDVCGFEYKASQLLSRWDGLKVCKHDYERRHPQDFLKTRVDKQQVPWSRPENTTEIYGVYEADVFEPVVYDVAVD